MNAFIFEQYGYYPSENNRSQFEIQGWLFKLVETTQSESEIQQLSEITQQINLVMHGQAAHLIRSRSGTFVVTNNDKSYLLWAVPKNRLSWSSIFQLHQTFANYLGRVTYPVKELIGLWEEKVEFIESKSMLSLRIDEKLSLDVLTMAYLGLGLAENAMQYLADSNLDEGNQVTGVTLCHKRLMNLESDTCMDPQNWVYDSPIRDLTHAFVYELMPMTEWLQWVDLYRLNRQQIALLMARILYPVKIFDLLESHYMDRVDIRPYVIKQYQQLSADLLKVHHVHLYFIRRFNIRPIPWLINWNAQK